MLESTSQIIVVITITIKLNNSHHNNQTMLNQVINSRIHLMHNKMGVINNNKEDLECNLKVLQQEATLTNNNHLTMGMVLVECQA